mmetsp:Transcript_12473/g.22620  ORF Transcript_12473/g.22620 Transcript_12473/m.22620 type:complete len:524 (-) Transcript_12473:75-1646(-)
MSSAAGRHDILASWIMKKRGASMLTLVSAMYCIAVVHGFSTPQRSLRIPHAHGSASRSIGFGAVPSKDRSGRLYFSKSSNLVKDVVDTYVDYASRLWNETSTDARREIAQDKAKSAIRTVQHLVRGEEYVNLGIGDEAQEAGVKMLEACDLMLHAMGKDNSTNTIQSPLHQVALAEATTIGQGQAYAKSLSEGATSTSLSAKKKPQRSILFGAIMGAIVAGWVFSGNYIFTGLFTLMTILGQLEYYRMVMNTGVYPARRISIVGACAMFVTALLFPNLHQVVLPTFACYSCIWFLTMRRTVSTIPEIATTFMGMFYLGYIPSFWVRIRTFGGELEPTSIAPLVAPMLNWFGQTAEKLPSFIPKSIHLPITTGSIFIFWSWLCIAFSDVGAYFVGRKFGRTKLGQISPAAGATSPNKTVEGVIGGCVVSGALGMLGAWVMKWPRWYLTGAVHGVMLAMLGLIGDLTASMLKRDAGLKDFGDLLPEHGGIMDRVDSFIFSAPYSWIVIQYVIPFLKAGAKTKLPV